MLEKFKKVSNPLTIIAIFSGLAEISGTIILPFIKESNQTIYIWFLMIFPILIVILFFITLNWNSRVLYAPSDFKDEANYMKAFQQPDPIELELKLRHELQEQILDGVQIEENKLDGIQMEGNSSELLIGCADIEDNEDNEQEMQGQTIDSTDNDENEQVIQEQALDSAEDDENESRQKEGIKTIDERNNEISSRNRQVLLNRIIDHPSAFDTRKVINNMMENDPRARYQILESLVIKQISNEYITYAKSNYTKSYRNQLGNYIFDAALENSKSIILIEVKIIRNLKSTIHVLKTTIINMIQSYYFLPEKDRSKLEFILAIVADLNLPFPNSMMKEINTIIKNSSVSIKVKKYNAQRLLEDISLS